MRVEIFDVRRRVVRSLVGPVAAGDHAVAWDGRDDLGNPVGRGVYHARVSGGGVTRTQSVVRVK